MGSMILPNAFRNLMRRVPSPVVVVTTGLNKNSPKLIQFKEDKKKEENKEEEPITYRRGITVGSFQSISLNPPIISFSVNTPSKMHDLLSITNRFCCHILGKDQVQLSVDFSSNQQRSDQFENLPFYTTENDIPVLMGSLGVIHCEGVGFHKVGDHHLWLGQVLKVEEGSNQEPLLYYSRSYRSIGDQVFIQSFEDTSLQFNQWTHRAHVRMAWNYIRDHGKTKAIPIIVEGIKRYNEKNFDKISHGFNETITMFFIELIDLAIKENPQIDDFWEFIQTHPFLDGIKIIFHFYEKEKVYSSDAKSKFILPTLKPMPASIQEVKTLL